eukprot:gnl/Chilomastix_caulleri/3258.p1 GENE.gnl/Chilomastix_caulleri/3258~~gnl/Chilomastix_caulleri/3258.p1  ORF type:complete len:109 (+),score=9.23 gnl/Chilomastix_caulleri/3258:1-327(+)
MNATTGYGKPIWISDLTIMDRVISLPGIVIIVFTACKFFCLTQQVILSFETTLKEVEEFAMTHKDVCVAVTNLEAPELSGLYHTHRIQQVPVSITNMFDIYHIIMIWN